MKGEAAFQVGLAYQRAGDHSTAKKVPQIVFDFWTPRRNPNFITSVFRPLLKILLFEQLVSKVLTAVTQRREQSVIEVGAKGELQAGKENQGLGEKGEDTTR